MARYLLTMVGLALCALGIWGVIAWWGAVKVVLMAMLVLGAVLLGLLFLILGVSEIAGANGRRATAADAPQHRDT